MKYVAAIVLLLLGGSILSGAALTAPLQFPDIFNQDKKPPTEVPQPENKPAVPPKKVAPDLEERIQALEAELQSKRPQALKDLASARQLAAEYRQRVDRVRRLLYLPDPTLDQDVGEAVKTFQTRWSDLARQLLDGQIPTSPVNAERWARYAPKFENLYCDRVPTIAPPKGMPLIGMSWACLADLFFKDLSRVETGMNTLMTAKRIEVTADLDKAMKLVELKLAGAQDQEPPAFIDRVAELLHQVDLLGLRLRIRELEFMRSDGAAGPSAFRWFLDLSPAVRRPAEGSTADITVQTSARLAIRAGAARVEATIRELPRQTQLAQELHKIHYRLAQLKLRGDTDETRLSRDAAERDRARVLGQMAELAQ